MTTTIDLGAAYRSARLRICASVDDDMSALPVPATPLWNVHDVIAHLAGAMEDARLGNLDGVATDPWTAAQVERGRSKSVAELIEQWAADAAPVEAFLSTPEGELAARAVIDVHTHEADLQNVRGELLTLPDAFLAWASALLLDGFFDAVAAAGLPAVTVTADAAEVFRSRLGRRTEAEVVAYEWSADPQPYLDHWFIFGRAEHSLGERVSSDS